MLQSCSLVHGIFDIARNEDRFCRISVNDHIQFPNRYVGGKIQHRPSYYHHHPPPLTANCEVEANSTQVMSNIPSEVDQELNSSFNNEINQLESQRRRQRKGGKFKLFARSQNSGNGKPKDKRSWLQRCISVRASTNTSSNAEEMALEHLDDRRQSGVGVATPATPLSTTTPLSVGHSVSYFSISEDIFFFQGSGN